MKASCDQSRHVKTGCVTQNVFLKHNYVHICHNLTTWVLPIPAPTDVINILTALVVKSLSYSVLNKDLTGTSGFIWSVQKCKDWMCDPKRFLKTQLCSHLSQFDNLILNTSIPAPTSPCEFSLWTINSLQALASSIHLLHSNLRIFLWQCCYQSSFK